MVNESPRYGQQTTSCLTLRVRQIPEISTIQICLSTFSGNGAAREVSWREIEGNVAEIDYLLNSSWQMQPDPVDEIELARCVRDLSETLLGSPITDSLRAAGNTPLIIDSPLHLQRIPWEHLEIDGLCLGERFPIGRKVSDIETPPPSVSSSRKCRAHVAAVSSPDLTWTAWELPSVRAALRKLAWNSDGRLTPPEPISDRLTARELIRCLSRNDWLHFAGHTDAAFGGRGWSVEPETLPHSDEPVTVLTPDEVLHSGMMAPEVVFAHGCATLQIPVSSSSTLCMTEALIRRGTRWLLGPTVPTLDSECRHLVEPFYDGVARGLSIGEALRKARVVATRRCPDGKVRWLSYVLYGNPTEHFVSGNEPATGSQPTIERQEASLPQRSQRESFGQSAASEATPQPAEASAGQSIDNSAKSGNVAGSVPSSSADEVESAREDAVNSQLHFLKQIRDAIAKFRRYRDFRSGRTVAAHLEESQGGRNAAWNFETFGKTKTEKFPSKRIPSRLEYRLVSDDATAPLPEVLISFDWLDVPAVTHDSVPGPAALDQVASILKYSQSAFSLDGDAHKIRVIAGPSGFDRPVISRFCATSSGRALRPGLSVVLIDLRTSEVYYRSSDLKLMPFLPLIDLCDEESCVQQVVEHVQKQLPLAAGLGARTVATDLQLPEQIVSVGFRIVACRCGLLLDDLPQHGLVLSERTGMVTDETQTRI